MMSSTAPGLLLAAAIATACGDDKSPTQPSTTAAVMITYVAPTRPELPSSVDACVRGVGATHVHPSWRDFGAVTMAVASSERFEISLSDAPVGQRLSIRVSDANACLENDRRRHA